MNYHEHAYVPPVDPPRQLPPPQQMRTAIAVNHVDEEEIIATNVVGWYWVDGLLLLTLNDRTVRGLCVANYRHVDVVAQP